MKYEIIEVDKTTILKMENGETHFLNETATEILKACEKGMSDIETFKHLCSIYNIEKEKEEMVKEQISSIMQEVMRIIEG